MTKYIVKSYLALVNRFEAFAKNLGSFGLAVIYTIGHIWIAIPVSYTHLTLPTKA